MTLMLAIETSTRHGGVALMNGTEVMSQIDFSPQKPASEMLLPAINELLETHDVSIHDIERIATANGPGSFTGLRVGLTTAKTLAYFLNISVIPVPTLDGMAAPVMSESLPVLVIQDARKSEVYYSLYSPSIAPAKHTDYAVGRLKSAFENIESCMIVGDALFRYKDEVNARKHPEAQIAPEKYWRPDPCNIGRLAASNRYDAIKGETLFKLSPIYVRLPEAEIQWRKKQLSD